MAKLHHLLFLPFLLSLAITPSVADDDRRSDPLLQSQKAVRRPLREKLSHLRFYLHDIITGPNLTAVRIVSAPAPGNPMGFGAVMMIDDPLTQGPEMSSELVGRAQGLYSTSSNPKDPKDTALLMAMNLAFVAGKYNGSTVAILGRNAVFSGVREMPVVGGSGLFRLARGYAQATTHSLDTNGNAVLEYNVFVTHY